MDRSPVYRRPVQFRVLGPLEVDAGEGPIPLGGPKQRAVLANLLIRANQVVPADVLIDDVWGEETPEKARHILQTYVSNLRKSLGDGRLERRPSGYLLVVEPFELDAARFHALVANAKRALPVDPSVAIETIEDALALWRGPALADLTDQPSLLAEAARLDELRIEAQGDRIEGLLASSEHARAIGELEPLLARHPLRETLWGLVMLAYYRGGRQADALIAYGRARELLADELGIDPSPELARLHERILKQDPGLDLRGEPLRGYRLLEKIGSGSHGAVFRGVQPRVGRDVAVKVFHEGIAADPEFVRRFERDAQIVAALEHPHIAPTYDYWREPGRAYLVSRYMRGGSLRALLERGGVIDRGRALRIVSQIASALAFAHRQGVVHGRVRASNVLLDGEGNAYLADFGVGAGGASGSSEDIRELTTLARDLLRSDMPPSLVEVLDDGIEADDVIDADAIARVALGVLDPDAAPRVRTVDERNPYKGLRPFGEADTKDFFGRAELTERLLARLNEADAAARFLAVVGPSGGGKSSVVRAGVAPALRSGGLATSNQVLVTEMFPGAHPWDELEAALVRVAVRPPTRLGDILQGGSRGLLEAVELVIPSGAELVLIVDQFEELFTLTTGEREREQILESLRVAAVDPTSRLRVIVTLRADLYDRPLIYPRFGELLAARNETVPPLTPDELEQAIRRPAERQGVRLDPGLVAEMIADVAHQPGGLPLLQYALTELFERRDGDRLTLSAYREIGGVTGALSSRADRLFSNADADGRRAIEQVFLRLVTLGEGRQDTRRRVAMGELDTLDVSDVAVGAAIESFGRHRLLTFDREPSTREPTVEIAHEALLRAWGRLASWIDAAREDIRQNERVARAAAEWRGSGGDPSFLMGGSRLDQVEAWAEATALSIGSAERAYLKASVDQRDRARLEERARRAREAQIERRSVRRLRGLVAVFAVAALVAGSLTIVATNQGGRAEREARVARARELAAAAVANLDADPDLSIILAMEAVRITRSVDGWVSPEAVDALHRAIASSRIERTVPGVRAPIAWSPDGVFAAQSSNELGTVEVLSTASGEPLFTIPAHDGKVSDVAFSANGDLLATAGVDGSLRIWDVSTAEPVLAIPGVGTVEGVSFDAAGSLVSAAWPEDKTVRVVDPSTGRGVMLARKAHDTSLSPEGDRIAIVDGADHDRVHVIDVGAGTERFGPLVSSSVTEETYGVGSVSWSPDGRSIATVSASALDIWDGTSGELRSSSGLGASSDMAWSRDSSRLVTSGTTMRVWEVDQIRLDPILSLTSLATAGEISSNSVAISADGTHVAATSIEGDGVSIWDGGDQGDAEWANLPTKDFFGDVEFLPDGRVVAVGPDGKLTIWDSTSGEPLGTLGPPKIGEHRLSLSPNGRSLAITDYPISHLTAWDVASGRRLFGFDAPGITVLHSNWSPDGGLLAASFFHEGGDPAVEGGTRIFDRRGRVVGELGEGGEGFIPRFGPDGRLLAVSGGGGVTIWDWERRVPLGVIPGGDENLAFAAGRVALVGSDGVPEIWNARSRTRLSRLTGASSELCSIALSPDGSLVATGGGDGAVKVFDAETGDQILSLRGYERAVCGLAFSPDGAMLAAQGLGMVRIWAMDLDDLLTIARQNVTRSLTDEECRQYLHIGRCPSG
jgi:WD40 repeat protein/DNA-binding SARP family transcriptional activator